MEDKRQVAKELLDWISQQNRENLGIEFYEETNSIGLKITAPHAVAVVNIVFMEFTVVEYRIINDKDESVFYLHFELNELEHAKELFTEMKECLLKQTGSQVRQILLCCSCGLTTSYFMMKLNEVAEVLDSKMSFSAVPYEKLYEQAADKDVILIAPQIGYQLKNVQSILKDKIVMMVPVQIFSTYDGAGMINLLNETFAQHDGTKPQKEKPSLNRTLDMQNGSVLIVSVVNMEGRNQIAYRIYDHGKITAENQITKEYYRFSDIMDVIQVAVHMNAGLEKVAIVTPGMVHDGKLTFETANIADLDVCAQIREKFGKEAYLYNDADMIALGYANTERDGADTALYFLTTGSYAGNVGIVANGSLIQSARHMGGRQLESITNLTTFPQNPYALCRTPEGTIELTARYLTGLYSYTGIDHIAFYSSMIPDAQMLADKMKEFIPEQYMPGIVKLDSVRSYMYQGVLYSLQENG